MPYVFGDARVEERFVPGSVSPYRRGRYVYTEIESGRRLTAAEARRVTYVNDDEWAARRMTMRRGYEYFSWYGDQVELVHGVWRVIGSPSRTFAAYQIEERPKPKPLRRKPPVDEEGSVVPAEEVASTQCPCKFHQAKRLGTQLAEDTVNYYSATPPGGWTGQSMPNDPFDYYLGVELETDSYAVKGGYVKDRYGAMSRAETIQSEVSREAAADMRQPKELWLPKSDSSVSGPEFASQPATITYWNAKRAELTDMFADLLHAGYRSHDTDRCGMHINISRVAFSDRWHLARFLTLLHANIGWSRRVSQRTAESEQHWAPLSYYKDKRARDELCKRVMRKKRNGELDYVADSHDKYDAFHAPSGQPRFEFRLPRGTLRIDRFFKNLQWVVGMIEYTRKVNVLACRPKAFMAWVMENREVYPDLANFFVEKKMLDKVAATT